MKKRDQDEFTAFVAGSQDRLRRSAYLLCGDWQRAADITQEALIRVYVAWPRLDRRGGLPTYARRALVSASIDMSRRRWSREGTFGETDDIVDDADATQTLTDREALMQAMKTLPPRQRACVVLRYFEDLTVQDTAVVLGCSEGTVKSQTSRAIQLLRSHFEAQHREELVASMEGGQPW